MNLNNSGYAFKFIVTIRLNYNVKNVYYYYLFYVKQYIQVPISYEHLFYSKFCTYN